MTDDPVDALARDAARRLTQILTALMVEAVDQVRDAPDTARHAESTVYMQDLAAEALRVKHITPESAVFGLARANAAMIVELCKRLHTDPRKLMKSFEETFFRLTL